MLGAVVRRIRQALSFAVVKRGFVRSVSRNTFAQFGKDYLPFVVNAIKNAKRTECTMIVCCPGVTDYVQWAYSVNKSEVLRTGITRRSYARSGTSSIFDLVLKRFPNNASIQDTLTRDKQDICMELMRQSMTTYVGKSGFTPPSIVVIIPSPILEFRYAVFALWWEDSDVQWSMFPCVRTTTEYECHLRSNYPDYVIEIYRTNDDIVLSASPRVEREFVSSRYAKHIRISKREMGLTSIAQMCQEFEKRARVFNEIYDVPTLSTHTTCVMQSIFVGRIPDEEA